MSRWAPLERPIRWLLRKKPLPPQEQTAGSFQKAKNGAVHLLMNLRPISLLTRLLVWVIRGTPLMLQLIILFFIPGIVLSKSPWPAGEAGRFMASAIAFIINYACEDSEI